MARSLGFLLVHLVFSTKDRAAVLDETVRPDLYAYLSTIVRSNECECFRVGGVADHVHLAVRLNRKSNVADLVAEMKASSSKWLKSQSPKLAKFAWQRGYGAFSVGPADLNALIHYIGTQEAHHAKHTFQDELRAFMVKYGVECEERYLWD